VAHHRRRSSKLSIARSSLDDVSIVSVDDLPTMSSSHTLTVTTDPNRLSVQHPYIVESESDVDEMDFTDEDTDYDVLLPLEPHPRLSPSSAAQGSFSPILERPTSVSLADSSLAEETSVDHLDAQANTTTEVSAPKSRSSSEWPSEQVSQWLEQVGLQQYSSLFSTNGMTGAQLPLLVFVVFTVFLQVWI
jgi:hypothetical protein